MNILCPICHQETIDNYPATITHTVIRNNSSCFNDTNHRFILYDAKSHYAVLNIGSNIVELTTTKKRSTILMNSKVIGKFGPIEVCEIIKYIHLYLKLRLFF